MVGSPSFKGSVMRKFKTQFVIISISLMPLPCFAQIEGLKSKLLDLLYIFVPLIFLVSVFFIADWNQKRRGKEKFGQSNNLPGKKKNR